MPKVGELIIKGSNAEGDDVWDDVCGMLESVIRDMGEPTNWLAKVENFGWDNRSGSLRFKAETGADFLTSVLPNTDCSFKIYKYGEKGIAIDNAHHDKPTGGEWYYITAEKD